ncbi:MAG: DUF927 domain-containing protein [Beijerinckiaceae bacterium]
MTSLVPVPNINALVAFVSEPADIECVPDAKWSVRSLQKENSSETFVEIGYYNRKGEKRSLVISTRERGDPGRIWKELLGHGARVPVDRSVAIPFVIELMRAVPTASCTMTSSSGFRNAGTGFVMPTYMLGTAKENFIWNTNVIDNVLIAPRGSVDEFMSGVLEPCTSSAFLSAAPLISLGATLWDHSDQARVGAKLVSEGATFEFAGDSTGGKSTLIKLAQAPFGSLDTDNDFATSDRGIAEAASRRNGLVVGLDDTEAACLSDSKLVAKIRAYSHRLACGHSRSISRQGGARAYEPLSYRVFGVATGPETLASLMARTNTPRQGDRVRWFDLQIPLAKTGGVFADAVPRAQGAKTVKDRQAFLAAIDDAAARNCGVLTREWARYLLRHGDPDRAHALVRDFVLHVAADESSLEQRFARKLAVLYAAGVLGVEAGLLPWKTSWVFQVVRFLYENARQSRDPQWAATQDAIHRLAEATRSRAIFPRAIVGADKPPKVGPKTLGLKRVREGKVRFLLAPDRLTSFCSDPGVGKRLIQRLRETGVLAASGNSTKSEQVRVRGSDGSIGKVRFWTLRRKRLFTLAKR